MLPSQRYAERLQAVPPAWDKAFDVNASEHPSIRASCVEFVLAGLYALDRISRSQKYVQISMNCDGRRRYRSSPWAG